MRCPRSCIRCHRLGHFAISFLILVISTSSQFGLFSAAEGRRIRLAQTADDSMTVNEAKALLRAHIGSRPPRCDRRCASCAHCEAIQVPTNPQTTTSLRNSTTGVSDVAYARGDGSSNYKPMSWKCKCGHRIFNP